MDTFGIGGKFKSISQRVASTYQRMLTAFCPVVPDEIPTGKQVEIVDSQQQLHSFFSDLYDALYTAPEAFGLPVTEDIFLLSDHGKDGPKKTDVKRLLDRPRKYIEEGLMFLRSAAASGKLYDQNLLIEPQDPSLTFLKKKSGRAWINGLASIGLSVVEGSGPIILTSERYPKIMTALQALAQASERCENSNLGLVFFSRCDFKALRDDFNVDPLDLFHVFGPEDRIHAEEIHAFFTERGYQTLVWLERIFQWDVKYQGKRTFKASPLFKIIFDERLLHPMRTQIKIASATRVAPIISNSSQALQSDFSQRLFPCHDCGWCANKRGIQHPMAFSYQGQERRICWYVNPDIDNLTEEAIALIKEYTLLHEEMAG